MHASFRMIIVLVLSCGLSACAPIKTQTPQEMTSTGAMQTGTGILQESPNEQTPATADSLEASEITGAILKSSISESGTILVGEAKSSHHLIMFLDYDCLYCRHFLASDLPWIEQQMLKNHTTFTIERVFVPLSEKGEHASKLALCAAEQEKFPQADAWLWSHSLSPFDEKMFAKAVGLNIQKLSSCAARENLLAGNAKKAAAYNVERVPFFVLDTDSWLGLLPKEELRERIETGLSR